MTRTGNAFPADERQLFQRAAGGDEDARAGWIESHRERLLRIIALRLDARVRRRVDPSDVLQDATLEAIRRFDECLADPSVPPFLWLRGLVMQRVALAHREHLKVGKRDVRREVQAGRAHSYGPSSVDLAAHLVSGRTTPSQAAIRRETRASIRQALEEMDPLDREVLILRHFEQLKNVDAAMCLGIAPAAATKRYQRALQRLGGLLKAGRISEQD